jgi:hypothetical protein
MLDHATPVLSGLQLPDEVELQLAQAGVIGLADDRCIQVKGSQAQMAAEVMQALRQARYVILERPEDGARQQVHPPAFHPNPYPTGRAASWRSTAENAASVRSAD